MKNRIKTLLREAVTANENFKHESLAVRYGIMGYKLTIDGRVKKNIDLGKTKSGVVDPDRFLKHLAGIFMFDFVGTKVDISLDDDKVFTFKFVNDKKNSLEVSAVIYVTKKSWLSGTEIGGFIKSLSY